MYIGYVEGSRFSLSPIQANSVYPGPFWEVIEGKTEVTNLLRRKKLAY